MSDILKKLKSESGSAMILALFLMILVSIVMISFSNQVANQIRSTINLDKDIQEMYSVESDIEECIADFIQNIEIKSKDAVDIPAGKSCIDCGSYKLYYKNNYDINDFNIIIDNQNEVDSNNNIVKVNFIITVQEKDYKESKINVVVSNINSENNYKIDYGVELWRIRN